MTAPCQAPQIPLGWLVLLLIINSFVPKGFLVFAAVKVPGFAVGAVMITMTTVVAFLGGFFKSAAVLVRLAIDLSAGTAVCLEGRTWTSVDNKEGKGMDALHGERVDHHYYVVSNRYLPVTSLGYAALRPYSGSVCRVYLMPRSRLLLSIEAIKITRA